MALDERRAAYHWHPGSPHDSEGTDSEKTDVREAWFSGCHSGTPSFFDARKTSVDLTCYRADVGEGSVLNETRNSLARISLRWKIHESFRTQTRPGIQFRRNVLENLGIDIGTLDPRRLAPLSSSVATRHPNTHTATRMADGNPGRTEGPLLATKEEEEERVDTLGRMHNQLEMVKAWWMLEWLPLRHRRQYDGYSRPKALLVVGCLRTTPCVRLFTLLPCFYRMYVPKAKLALHDVEWVD
jgi:hypothetical protein